MRSRDSNRARSDNLYLAAVGDPKRYKNGQKHMRLVTMHFKPPSEDVLDMDSMDVSSLSTLVSCLTS